MQGLTQLAYQDMGAMTKLLLLAMLDTNPKVFRNFPTSKRDIDFVIQQTTSAEYSIWLFCEGDIVQTGFRVDVWGRKIRTLRPRNVGIPW